MSQHLDPNSPMIGPLRSRLTRHLSTIAVIALATACTDSSPGTDDDASTGSVHESTGVGGSGSETAGDGSTTGSSLADELQRNVTGVVPSESDGGVIALVVRDGTTAQAVAGTANLGGDPLLAQSKFSIASITKVYTATLVYQLEDQGLLDTSAPLSTYLPETDYGPDVTLDTLLSHRSGIADYATNPAYVTDVLADLQRVFTTEELIEYAMFEPPSPAGETYAYSNTGYSLLGLVIEEVTQEPLTQALQTGIVAPLGLTSTSFIDPLSFPDDLPSAWLDPQNFGLPPETELPVMPVPAPFSGCSADCGIVTTAPELRIFFEALFDGTLVSEASLAKMTSSDPDAPNEGRGLEIFDVGAGAKAYGHGGGGTGYTSLAAYEPVSGAVTIFFASNDTFELESLFAAYEL